MTRLGYVVTASIVIWAMLLSGCSMYRTVIAERGAETSDALLESTLWTLCNAMPIGAVTRHINTPELQHAYATLCTSIRD